MKATHTIFKAGAALVLWLSKS